MYDEHPGVGRVLIYDVFEKDHALLGRRPDRGERRDRGESRRRRRRRREMFLKSQRRSRFTIQSHYEDYFLVEKDSSQVWTSHVYYTESL